MAFEGILALVGTNFLAMTDMVAPESMMAVTGTPLTNTFMTRDLEICNTTNSALRFFEFSLSVCMGTGGGVHWVYPCLYPCLSLSAGGVCVPFLVDLPLPASGLR